MSDHSFVDGLDDDDVDELLDRLADRADQRDDLQLPSGGASRRGVLAALLGAGGIGAAASQASAIGESESYGSSTGVAGTDSEPLSEANIQDAHVQDLVVDSLAEIDELTLFSQIDFNGALAPINTGEVESQLIELNTSNFNNGFISYSEFQISQTDVNIAVSTRAAETTIYGQSTSDRNTVFVDKVTHSADDLSRQTLLDTVAATRNYSSPEFDLDLSMSSGTYNVFVKTTRVA